MQHIFDTVAIIGPGLVGGSLGKALRTRGLVKRVVGIGRREKSLREAIEVGAVDEMTLEICDGVRDADLVVLATPISVFGRLMGDVAASMKQGAMLTDVASTKKRVAEMITTALDGRPDVVYIPTHPMAGSERRSARNADANLFEASVCIFTPLPDTPAPELERLQALWQRMGATVHLMDLAEHDRLVARVSHLPHLAVAALLGIMSPEEGDLAGSGLIDTTRVASGDPALWRDICESNAEAIESSVEAYVEVIERIRALIASGDFGGLEELLHEAKRKRDDLVRKRQG